MRAGAARASERRVNVATLRAPGQSSGSSTGGAAGTLGALVSQRDIAPQEIP